MSVVIANLGASVFGTPVAPDFKTDTDLASYPSAAWTPPAAGMVLCAVYVAQSGVAADLPTVSGNGLTWVQIATAQFGSSNIKRLTLFAADCSGSNPPTNGATTVDLGGVVHIGVSVAFCHVTGVDLSGGVAAAFVQAVVVNSGASATTGSVTLADFASPANRPWAWFAQAANEDTTPKSGWTELDDIASAGPVRGMMTETRNGSQDLVPSATWTTATVWGGMAVELKALPVQSVAADFNRSPAFFPWAPSDDAIESAGRSGRLSAMSSMRGTGPHPYGGFERTLYTRLHQIAALFQAVNIVAATTTDTARALDIDKHPNIVNATETDTAQALDVDKHVTLGIVSTTDTAIALVYGLVSSGKTITPVSVADTARALDVDKHVTLGVATETDTARALSFTKTIRKTLGIVSEADTARALDIDKHVTLGVATETDTARTLSFTKTIRKTLGIVSEADTARALDIDKKVTFLKATETDTARALDIDKKVTIVKATEADTVRALDVDKAVTIVKAAVADTARALDVDKHVTILKAIEVDTAQDLRVSGPIIKTLGIVTVANTAQPLSYIKPIVKTITKATTTDTARLLNMAKRKTISPAQTVDSARTLSVTHAIRKTLTPAVTLDVALPLIVSVVGTNWPQHNGSLWPEHPGIAWLFSPGATWPEHPGAAWPEHTGDEWS